MTIGITLLLRISYCFRELTVKAHHQSKMINHIFHVSQHLSQSMRRHRHPTKVLGRVVFCVCGFTYFSFLFVCLRANLSHSKFANSKNDRPHFSFWRTGWHTHNR